MVMAQVLHDAGQFRASAALFDSIAQRPLSEESASHNARHRAWAMTLAGTGLAAAGDSARLADRANAVQNLGARSSLCRDPLLHHYLRGLLLQKRGDHERAVSSLRSAICTATLGYTRMNMALAQSLLTLNRPREAVDILQPALRGSLEGSNFYTTRAEVHDLLAEAWDLAGQRDSAAAHYRILIRVWANADAVRKARVSRAKQRLAALEAPAKSQD